MRTAASIRPTALGVKGVLLFVALELAFFATDYSNLFFLLLAFSAALGALGACWAWQNLGGLRVESLQIELAAAECRRPVTLRLAAERRVRFDVAVELRLAAGRAELAHAPMLQGEVTLQRHLPPQPRGVEQVEALHQVSRFPFGLLRVRRRVPVQAEVVTYPAPAPSDRDGTTGRGTSTHGGGAQAAGRGDAVASLRTFRTGDAVSDVSWKATARRGRAVVKEREREQQPCIELVIDRRQASDALEQALSRAATLALAARHDAPARILSQGADWTVDPERGGVEAALRWLAAAAPLPSDSGPPRPAATRGGCR